MRSVQALVELTRSYAVRPSGFRLVNGYKLTETATDLLLPPGFNHSWLVARVGFVSMREDGFTWKVARWSMLGGGR